MGIKDFNVKPVCSIGDEIPRIYGRHDFLIVFVEPETKFGWFHNIDHGLHTRVHS